MTFTRQKMLELSYALEARLHRREQDDYGQVIPHDDDLTYDLLPDVIAALRQAGSDERPHVECGFCHGSFRATKSGKPHGHQCKRHCTICGAVEYPNRTCRHVVVR